MFICVVYRICTSGPYVDMDWTFYISFARFQSKQKETLKHHLIKPMDLKPNDPDRECGPFLDMTVYHGFF